MPKITLLALAALIACASGACAQAPTPTPQPAATLKIESKLVAVSAVVHGESGQPVPNLTRQDFQLKDDGKPEEITYFSQGSDLPLTLALLVDTSGSQTDFIPDEIGASDAFFPALMKRPDDRAVLMQFDSEIMELAELTNSVPKLEEALDKLTRKRGERAGSTRLYDAIGAVAHLELGNQLGRRAMVILTDGDDTASSFKIGSAIAEAQRADIMVYSVFYSSGGGNKKALDRISKATGGRVFTVGPQMSLKQIYAAISDDMRLAYEIGYRPPASKPDKFHKIEVKTTDTKQAVQAREGYYSR